MFSQSEWIALGLGLLVLIVLAQTILLLRKDKQRLAAAPAPAQQKTSTPKPKPSPLNEVELACLRTLTTVAAHEFNIKPRIPLASIISPTLMPQLADTDVDNNVDFVLFHPRKGTAIAAIQLRNPSAGHHDKQYDVLKKSGIRVIELRRKSNYSIIKMRDILKPLLQQSPPTPDEMVATISMQAYKLCCRCESPMSIKRARSGKHQGTLFWVCNKYPDCRFVELYTE